MERNRVAENIFLFGNED